MINFKYLRTTEIEQMTIQPCLMYNFPEVPTATTHCSLPSADSCLNNMPGVNIKRRVTIWDFKRLESEFVCFFCSCHECQSFLK